MDRLLLAVITAVIAFIFTGCTSIPNEEEDNRLWSRSPAGRLRDPDAMDEDRLRSAKDSREAPGQNDDPRKGTDADDEYGQPGLDDDQRGAEWRLTS